MTKRTDKRRRRPGVLATGALLLGLAAWPTVAGAYEIHRDRLDCPKGTTLLRIEVNPRECRAQPKKGIPATRGRRACCTIDNFVGRVRCLPFPGCPAESPS
ncbi:MAG TPA: hypothetical protein VFB01_18790 [Burkholderiales bacterium]|nr:hypothetical protein [Burkholderiales bacterium]